MDKDQMDSLLKQAILEATGDVKAETAKQIRMSCLALAAHNENLHTAESVIAVAKQYYAFVNGLT